MKSSRVAAQRTRAILGHLTRMSSSGSAAAPWRDTFVSHVEDMDEPSFVLSTLHPSSSSSSASETNILPRARTVIFRGMWAGLTANPKNPAHLNPSGVYETDLPTLTTDARMEKIPELFESAAGGRGAEELTQSRRGGPVEAVFWMPRARTQWRLRGHTYVIGPDIDSDAATPVRAALEGHMRRRNDDGDAGSWSWSRELTAHFGNLGPLMRGSFRNPPPGTPLSEVSGEGGGPQLGQRVEDLEDEVARRNFRVIVVVPEEVDRVDLTDPERARRWNYSLIGAETPESAPSWKVTELWP